MRRFLFVALASTILAQDKPADGQKAQQPAPTPAAPPTGEWFTGSIEVGYRWVTDIAGSVPTYNSVVDLSQGFRLFGLDSRIENRSKRYLDRLNVYAYGWGGDPNTTSHIDASKQSAYNFLFDYRSVAYYNAMPTYANPFLNFGSLLNQQSFYTRYRVLNSELDLRPGSRIIPYLKYSYSSNSGSGITDFVSDANEYPVANSMNEHTQDFQGGVRFEMPHYQVTIQGGATVFDDGQRVNNTTRSGGNRQTPFLGTTLFLGSLLQAYNIDGTSPYTRALVTANPYSWLDLYGQYSYSNGNTDVNYAQFNTGQFVELSSLLFYNSEQSLLNGSVKEPHTSATAGFEMRPLKRLRLVESWSTDRLHTASSATLAQALGSAMGTITGTTPSTFRLVDNYNQQELDIYFDVTSRITLRGGQRYIYGDTTVPLPFSNGFEQGELSQPSGIAGINARIAQGVTASFTFEGGNAAQAYYRTSLQNFRSYRARLRYQALKTLAFTFNLNDLTNDNPNPQIQYSFASYQYGGSLAWTPNKYFSLVGDYAYTIVRSDALYIVPQTFTPARNFYEERANQASGLLDFKIPAGWRTVHLTAGGALFYGWGSRPTRFYQPYARLTLPLVKHLDWNNEWRWYGFAEPTYVFEGFRDTQFVTSLRVYR